MITFSNLERYGRLGNQLFQIATTYAYAKDNNTTIGLPTWSYRSHFKLEDSIFDNYSTQYYTYHEIDSLNYNKIETYIDNVDLVGYFQSDKYFKQYKQDILDMFKVNKHINDYGFIHVRRGDYVQKQEYHPLQSVEYYINGMDELGKSTYYCFSDDIQWCKDNIKDSRLIYIENTTEIDDLKLMMSCSASIIANSSFSWWGAYLGNHDNVIIPKNWFGYKYSWFNIEDKCCVKWKIR